MFSKIVYSIVLKHTTIRKKTNGCQKYKTTFSKKLSVFNRKIRKLKRRMNHPSCTLVSREYFNKKIINLENSKKNNYFFKTF